MNQQLKDEFSFYTDNKQSASSCVENKKVSEGIHDEFGIPGLTAEWLSS